MLNTVKQTALKARGFFADKRGIAAIEFALIAPIMVAFYLITVEFQDYFTVDRKLTALTSALGDVVSQDDIVTNKEMNDVMKAIATMMTPYNTSALKMRISQVDVDNSGKAKVAWSDAKNMSALPKGSSYALPANLQVKNTSYVISESRFSYKSVVGYVLKNGISLDRKFYIQPRYVEKIKRTS